MKALDEYFLMVLSMLLLNRVHVFCLIWTEKHGSERVNITLVTTGPAINTADITRTMIALTLVLTL